MQQDERREHWENIYSKKQLTEVSWYQQTPVTSLEFLDMFKVKKDAKIIDIGGGDSLFVDHLLVQGYTNVTVLDISNTAIKRAQKRLGKDALKVNWIVEDAASFEPKEKYDFWHDRAAFHFLTTKEDITHYLNSLHQGLSEDGHLVIGTFSENGPTKCSGIEIQQYSEERLHELLDKHFKKEKCLIIDHITPAQKIQNFIFCGFKKKAVAS